jgi:hypothetical protein
MLILGVVIGAYLCVGAYRLHHWILLLRSVEDLMKHEAIKSIGWHAYPLILWTGFLILFLWPLYYFVRWWALWRFNDV